MRQQKKGRRGLGEKAKTGRRLLPFGAMGREPCGRCGFWAKRCAAKPFPGRAGSLGGKDRRRQKPPSKGEGGAVGFFVCAKGPKAAPAAPSPGSPPVSRPLAGPHTRHRRRQFGLAKGCRRPKAHRETAGGLDPSAFSSPYASSPCKKRSAHKTVNSHNRLNRCVCSCILSRYVIRWNRAHLQTGICKGVKLSL